MFTFQTVHKNSNDEIENDFLCHFLWFRFFHISFHTISQFQKNGNRKPSQPHHKIVNNFSVWSIPWHVQVSSNQSTCVRACVYVLLFFVTHQINFLFLSLPLSLFPRTTWETLGFINFAGCKIHSISEKNLNIIVDLQGKSFL